MNDITILDIGEYFIIATKSCACSLAEQLYNEMDLNTIEVQTNECRVNDDTLNLIYNEIGHIISYEVYRDDVLIRLEDSIRKAKCFMESAKHFSFNKVNVLQTTPNKQTTDISTTKHITDFSVKNEVEYCKEEDKTSAADVLVPSPDVIVCYNLLYNTCLVVDNGLFAYNKLTKEFPEFVILQELYKTDSDIIKHLKQHFHKKIYDSVDDVKKKLDAFSLLYNTPTDTNNEKKQVKAYIEYNYTLSNDPEHRMRANDLYHELKLYLCVENNKLFKVRCAIYLAELGLTKKRYSDGYYFYGISKKEYKEVNIEDVEKARELEREQWSQRNVTIANYKEMKMEDFEKARDLERQQWSQRSVIQKF